MRERVNSGKIQCGSGPHAALLDYEVERDRLPPRDRQILLMAERGWSHVTIADSLGISRSRVTHVLDDWLEWNEN